MLTWVKWDRRTTATEYVETRHVLNLKSNVEYEVDRTLISHPFLHGVAIYEARRMSPISAIHFQTRALRNSDVVEPS